MNLTRQPFNYRRQARADTDICCVHIIRNVYARTRTDLRMKATATAEHGQPAKHQLIVTCGPEQKPPAMRRTTAGRCSYCYLSDRVHSDKVSKSRRGSVKKCGSSSSPLRPRRAGLTAGRRRWARNAGRTHSRARTGTYLGACFDMRTRAPPHTRSTYQTK